MQTANDRAAEFYRRCKLLKLSGISLHSYRYAWAERAKSAGYPERFAQEALGHSSRAVHQAYARKAVVLVPPLEHYEKQAHILPAPALTLF
jgi:integrase